MKTPPHDDCNDDDGGDRTPPDARRGTRQLRVGLEIGDGPPRIVSVWLVDQPAIQHVRIARELLVRVDIGGRIALVEAFADPRIGRGVFMKGRGHSYHHEEAGIVYVSVPFTHLADLATVRIRVAETPPRGLAVTDPAGIAALFDDDKHGLRVTGDFASEQIRTHVDWLAVAATLGIPAVPGRFEIHRDDERRFRWRFVRPDGTVMARSDGGRPTRDECEADLRWFRQHVPSAPIVAADLDENSPKRAD